MIRRAKTADLGAVQRIVAAAYTPYVARIGRAPEPMHDDYTRRVADQDLWVLDHGGAVIGLVILTDTADGLMVVNLAVDPDHQGSGYGRRLMAFAETEARRRDHTVVRLYTNVLMTENIARYLHLGYHETGPDVQMGFDRVLMAKTVG